MTIRMNLSRRWPVLALLAFATQPGPVPDGRRDRPATVPSDSVKRRATQKPPIDTGDYRKWPSVSWGTAITGDGNYVAYGIQRGDMFGTPGKVEKTVVQSADGRWKKELPGISNVQFTRDGRLAFFTKPGDTLALVTLGSDSIQYLSPVRSPRYPRESDAEWLAYQPGDQKGRLVFRHLPSGRERSFSDVVNYVWTEDGSVLILETRPEGTTSSRLTWVDFPTGDPAPIWEGVGAGNITIDRTNGQLAFLVTENGGADRSIWHYRKGAGAAALVLNERSAGIDSAVRLDRISYFSKDGQRLFVTLADRPGPKPDPNAVNVWVWSYTDVTLQSIQREGNPFSPTGYTAAVDLTNPRVTRLNHHENDYVNIAWPGQPTSDDYALVSDNGSGGESHWNRGYRTQYLVSTRDGVKRWEAPATTRGGHLSLEGRFVIYFDFEAKSWHSFEIATGVTRDITKGVRIDWTPWNDDHVDAWKSASGVAGWLRDDAAVLLYDQFDIWQIDPSGKRSPINLTNGYGKRHDIFFQIFEEISRTPIAPDQPLILGAFNRLTKDNGFFRKVVGQAGDPELLSMGKFFYWAPIGASRAPDGVNFAPVKARNAERYLVRRMSATESANYFLTSDFKTFTRVSDIHPERDYNWLTAELVSWKTFKGKKAQGILYKPENFDPTKKYPVLFHYYEVMSNGLNTFRKPEFLGNGCTINIATYVSNGYLVFTPDIFFETGQPGPSAHDHVVSAARHLAKNPWVDSARMGIQGCSWGGYTTNYLVTHSNLFAAATTSSGGSDYISGYGGLSHGGHHKGNMMETGQHRMGASLWERPDLYLENTSILKANTVTTPLLLMHTSVDGAVAFSQAVEMFTALRRLGKRAWLLEYQDGNHGVLGKPGEDFSLRMRQFFDHYLKNAPPPLWMTRGIPARLKGVNTGLGLDTAGARPGPGLVNEKKDRRK